MSLDLAESIAHHGDIAELAAIHIQASGLKGLDILPSGPRPTNPHELLAGTRFSQFLAWAAGVYDQILIDSPPTLATSDTAIIGRLVDGVILVVQPAKNRRRLVTRVVESLLMLRITHLGLVINRVGSDQDQGYYSYHSGYGYGYGYSYGYGYGYGSDYGSHEEGAEGSDTSDESDPSEDTVPATSPEESAPPPRMIRRRAA